MNHNNTIEYLDRGRLILIQQGCIVAIIGMLSGFGFVFEILNAISVWPLSIETDFDFPGSERGWRIAHVAGVMNGMLMGIVGLALVHTKASMMASRWIVWGFVYTGWGNTLFFHFANHSSNRGLSAGPTQLGEADWIGMVGYGFGASTIPFTIAALVLLALSARRTLIRTPEH